MKEEENFNLIPPGTYRLHLETGEVDGVISLDHVFTSFEGTVIPFSEMTFRSQPPKIQSLRIEDVQAISTKPDPEDYEIGKLLDYLQDLVVYESESTGTFPVYIWAWSKFSDWDSESFSSASAADGFMCSDDQRFGYETTCMCGWGEVSEILNFTEYLSVKDQWDNARAYFNEHYSSEVVEVLDILKDEILAPYQTDE